MRRSPLSIYTPLLIVLLIQALVISVAPSRTPTPVVAGAALPGAPATGAGTTPTGSDDAPATAALPRSTDASEASPGSTVSSPAATTTGSTSPGSPGTTSGTAPASSTGPATTGSAPQPQGDTSHCTPDGRQHDVIFHAPPCVPKWEGGDNGGATARGVTGDTITVVLFRENKNEQVTAILNAYNLRATKAEDEEFMQAAEDFVNGHYELYGRKVDFVLFDAANCPETPPDVPACRAEAQRAIAEHQPFAVIWPTPVYPDVFDEFVKAGVIALGGWHFENSWFAGRRPYRYDVFMDGTRTAEMLSEYYCKKLVGGMATHAGRIIHPTFPAGGDREQNVRKLGVIVPEVPANSLAAQRVLDRVRGCGGEAEMYTYVTDIERSQEQAAATTAALIQDQVTTITCLCDPIAPVFRAESMSRNNYYPEWLLPGSGLLDYDLIGRLYDKRQMAHAFGPSHLQVFPPHDQSDSSKVWRASGRDGDACASCNLNASYFSMLAAMLQMAGPNLTAENVEAGTLNSPPRGGWAATGGDPTVTLAQFGRDDYTLLSDIKEVFWREDAISPIDGRPGAFVPMYEGQRWALGQLPDVFEVPQPAN